MKKVFNFFAVALVATALVSCGGEKKDGEAAATDSTAATTDTAATTEEAAPADTAAATAETAPADTAKAATTEAAKK